jgi:type VI secretion system secreted protein VgrG
MASFTQTNRPLRVKTPLGPDDLLPSSVSGVEGVSMPFRFVLDLLSENDSIAAASLLRKPVVITLDLLDGETREIHGLVNRFVQLGQEEDLVHYEAEIVPWLWFLSLSRDCRIFQNLSVLEIVEKVFQSQGYSDFENRCARSYPKREYCVQYRETHLDFVSRLLEEEGIFYFFEHTDAKHVLVLADDSKSLKPCPRNAVGRMATRSFQDEDTLTSLRQEHSVHIGKVALRNYDEMQPSLTLHGASSGDGLEEVYDYLGGFTKIEEGERYARLQLEAEEALRQLVRGEGSCRCFQSGFRMTVRDHYRKDVNGEYLLLQVQHSASVGDYRASTPEPFDYRNQFLAIPHDAPFRPARKTSRPRVHGTQTALVVGKAGEEIWVDKHGRVKVQFYWDRDGKKDENSSCWVRVSSNWAGKGWGAIQIPRMGQEVIVDFLDGDPDRPIITGRVYNAEQAPPYTLPANQTQSGVKSRSSKGGGTENFNEIRMEDKKGSELLYVHAEKDKQVEVENNRDEHVGGNETIEIDGNRTESVKKNEDIAIKGNRKEDVSKNETIAIGGNRSETVGGNETVSIAGNRGVTVDKNETLDVGASRTMTIGKNESLTIGQSRATKVGKDDQLDVGKKLIISAGDEIQIKTGSASITMKKNGTITIKGKDVNISGSGKINIKASSDVTIKGSQIKQN